MTAEEYIKSKKYMNYDGGCLCSVISEEDALKAIEMARSERDNVWHDNNVMPKCNENCLIIDEQGDIDYGYLVYDDFDKEYTFITDSWDYSMGNIKKWAYIDELPPSTSRKNKENLRVYPIENTIPIGHQKL